MGDLRGSAVKFSGLAGAPMDTTDLRFRICNTPEAAKPTPGNNGAQIFRAELSPAIAANPFVAFFTVATESGTLAFEWSGDNGFSASETAAITVE
jgi:hypothetical protein